MKKKLTAFLLTALMLLNVSVVFAGEPTGTMTASYWPGETHRTITAKAVIAQNNADVSGDSVTIHAGGSATWGFYIPYGARSVTINHSGAANITIKSDDVTYNFALTGVNDGAANLLVFGENLGREAQMRVWAPDSIGGYVKEFVEHEGEKEITITADSDVTIESLVFEKEKLPGPTPTKIGSTLTDIIVVSDISDYERNTLSTVMMDTNANIIMVNGGRRYIDNNNTDTIPYNYNGSIYLPINTLAKALGYYHEEDATKGYALMRSDSHEVILIDGRCTVQEGLGAVQEAPANAIIYRDGKALAAVRYFAELTGDTVGYKDGLVVIDNKYTVNDILNDSGFYSYATGKFAAFKTEKVKGNTYYVAQTASASDSNSGNILAPFKTLAKAAEVAKAGDTVIVREGVYRETLTPKNSGTANAPITFRAAEGENVTISAADSLGTLAKSNEDHASGYDIYTAGLPESLGLGRDQIFINGEMQTQARYPNGPSLLHDDSLSKAWPVKGNIYKVAGDKTTFRSDSLLNQEEEDYWKGSMWFGTFSNNYAHVSGVVESSSYGELQMSSKYNPKWWWETWCNTYTKPGERNSLNYGFLIGHEHALDIPGEWVRTDDDQLRIILPENVDPKTVQVEAKTRQLIADLNNKKYINIEGFNTIGGSVTMKDSEMCMLNDMNMKYITHYTLSADQRSGYIDFPYDRTNQNGAPQRGEVGLYIDGTDNIVVNSKIDHSAGCALYMTGTYSYIENNELKDCGYTSSYTSGIHCDTQEWDKASTPRGGYSIYNNTIYNLGRAAIDFCVKEDANDTNNHRCAMWLPCEIAYNDVHDAALTTEDGGMIYANGAVMGLDEQMSSLHHNYVYKTKVDYNAWTNGIYWDGNAHGCDTYSNLVFTTTPNANIPYNAVNRHTIISEGGADSSARAYNNMQLGYVGVDVAGLSEYHYPEEKMFYAGTFDNELRNMNYDRIKDGTAEVTYTAADAEVSDSAMTVGSDGFINYTADGQYVLFKDVDFGSGANELELYLRGDWNWSNDTMRVLIGDTKETAFAYNLKASIESYYGDATNTHGMMINETSGKKNVWVEVTDYHSVRIGGLSVWNHPNSQKTEEYTMLEYLSQRDSVDAVNKDFLSFDIGGGGVWPLAYPVKSVFSGNTAYFKDCVVEEDSYYFVMAAGARDHYNGQLVDVYVDDDTEPICTFTVRNLMFYDLRTPDPVPLNRVLPKGTYDLRLEFKGTYEMVTTDANGEEKVTTGKKTSNVNYFGFLGANDGTSDLYVYKNETGRYNAEASILDANKPFYTLRGPDDLSYTFILANTLPGTMVAYDKAVVIEDSSQFVIHYSAEEGYAGQEITIRLDDPNSEPVATITTEETGAYNYVTKSVKTNKVIPAGEHKAYISFGGEAGSGQTCRLAWFGFGK